jgi:hypothetical protein
MGGTAPVTVKRERSRTLFAETQKPVNPNHREPRMQATEEVTVGGMGGEQLRQRMKGRMSSTGNSLMFKLEGLQAGRWESRGGSMKR